MVTKCKQIIWARSILGPISNRTWAQPDCFSCTSSVPFRFIFPLVFNLSEFAAVVSLEKLPSSLTIVRNPLPPFLSPIRCARVYVKTRNLSWVSDFMIWALVIFLIFFLSNLKDWTFCSNMLLLCMWFLQEGCQAQTSSCLKIFLLLTN